MSDAGPSDQKLASTIPVNINIFQQNMAMLPELRMPNGDLLYRGGEREAALDSLVSFLRKQQPQLVGLSELWVASERQRLVSCLDDLYPHMVEGPGEASESAVDGGLLFLSSFTILASDGVVYDPCLGEDCLAQKGVLQIQVKLPGAAPPLELFLTHLQNPTPLLAGPDKGAGAGGQGKVQAQLDQLSTFIQRGRDPQYPALLLGDLNIAADEREEYEYLLTRLEQAEDLWPLTGVSGLFATPALDQTIGPGSGLTFDFQSTFALSDPSRLQDGSRHMEGKRLDYFLSFAGTQHLPQYRNTRVVQLESSPGHDISDHYGLMTELAELVQTV